MQRAVQVLLAALLLCASSPAAGSSPWGAGYFPNVPLVDHEGKTVRFFDDLIKDKVVAINFIYTSCPDSCPLETARMARVQKILGDRVGEDIFMYSITIDPEHDTPEVLARYRKRFRAQPGWSFLTGKEEDITELRKKLGLYIEEIQDGSNNHNLSLIIGNQATGQWLKRSPFENPYVLATQIGTWLTGWKAPPRTDLDYEDAPELRNISQGEHLFRTRCMSCHTIGDGDLRAAVSAKDSGLAAGLVGPDLLDVSKRRDRAWLERWIAEPDKMLEELDPIARGLFAKYDNVPMPNMRMSPVDVRDVLRYIDKASRRARMDRARAKRRGSVPPTTASAPASSEPADTRNEGNGGDVVAVMNAWIREAHPEADVHGGYMTLVNVASEDVVVTAVESADYEKVELHEMARVDGLMKMRELAELTVPAGGMAAFEPGGRHLMLHGPRRPLAAGDTVELTLTFRSGRRQTLSVRVEDR